eukprot:2052462-Prymnesium_polylepis.2
MVGPWCGEEWRAAARNGGPLVRRGMAGSGEEWRAAARNGGLQRATANELRGVGAVRLAELLESALHGRNLLVRDLGEHVVRHAVTIHDDALRRPVGLVALDECLQELQRLLLQIVDRLGLLLPLLLHNGVVLLAVVVRRRDNGGKGGIG